MTVAVTANELAARAGELIYRGPNNRNPRILQIVTRANVGGVAVHVVDLLRGLKDDFEMILATGEEGYLTEQARALGI